MDEIRILHGSNTNLLNGPSEAVLDGWAESGEALPEADVVEEDGAITVTVTGRLATSSGAARPISYVHAYRYTPWSVKHSLTLHAEGPVEVRRVSAVRMSFAGGMTDYVWGTSDFEKTKPRYIHIVGPHYDDILARVPHQPGVLQEDGARPWSVALIRRGWEGLQWCGDSHVYA